MGWMIGAIVVLVIGDIVSGLKLMASRRKVAELEEKLSDVSHRRGLLYREVTNLQLRIERIEKINFHAWRTEVDLRNRLTELDPSNSASYEPDEAAAANEYVANRDALREQAEF